MSLRTYRNPIIPGFYPDPSICRVGEDYYLVNSSFEYFPGVPIFHSRDLIHWRQIGHCLTRPSQLPLENAWSSGGIYAPTLRYYRGRFYMVTTNVSHGGHFYVSSPDPAGAWSEPMWVKDHGQIDPSLFFDEVGTVYFTSQGPEGILQSEIEIETGRILSEPRVIWTGSSGKFPEGPHLYKMFGKYYLMVAEGGTEYGHLEAMGRSDSPWGPFEICPHDPILTHRSYESPIQATGHADIVQDQAGNWWLVCLGVRPNGYPPCYHLGRETFLAPLAWTETGWPVVGQAGRIALEMEADCLPEHPWEAAPVRDDFDQAALRLDWNYLRNPEMTNYSLTERPGWMRLRGSLVTLDQAASPTFIGRRQREFSARAAALLDFQPEQDGEEAGMTVYMNERHHYEIGILREAGERLLFVRRRIGSLQMLVAKLSAPDGPLKLAIEADRDGYTFGFAVGGQPIQGIASGETRYLSTEVAGMFTGVYLGLYATGNHRYSQTPADFDWFELAFTPDEKEKAWWS
jgi:xylan 1,4-beta-xylosidase